jgi:hypothetical protein
VDKAPGITVSKNNDSSTLMQCASEWNRESMETPKSKNPFPINCRKCHTTFTGEWRETRSGKKWMFETEEDRWHLCNPTETNKSVPVNNQHRDEIKILGGKLLELTHMVYYLEKKLRQHINKDSGEVDEEDELDEDEDDENEYDSRKPI